MIITSAFKQQCDAIKEATKLPGDVCSLIAEYAKEEQKDEQDKQIRDEIEKMFSQFTLRGDEERLGICLGGRCVSEPMTRKNKSIKLQF